MAFDVYFVGDSFGHFIWNLWRTLLIIPLLVVIRCCLVGAKAASRSQPVDIITAPEKRRARRVVHGARLLSLVFLTFLPVLARETVRNESDALATVTKTVYRRMQEAGSMLINFNPMVDHKLPHFFRFVAVQPQVRSKIVG